MREIKFRARAANRIGNGPGEILYANIRNIAPVLSNVHDWLIFYQREGEQVRYVETKSLEQFIGVDKNGREVYEGDKIIFSNGQTKATLKDIDTIKYAITEGESQCMN